MRTGKDVWVVAAPIAILKRIEQVFIDNGCPYWTDGSFSDAQKAQYKVVKERGSTRILINLNDFYNHVTINNMVRAIKTELSDVLSGKEIIEWLNENKVRRSQIVQRES